MPAETTHRATVRLANGYRFRAEFTDIAGKPSLLLDEPAPLGGGDGPSAAAVVGVAVGNCLAASLLFCLRKAHADVQDLTAHVTTHVSRNDAGRFRITGIDVEIDPELAGADYGRLARCEELFEDFCTVTASIRQGIPVNVSLKAAVSS